MSFDLPPPAYAEVVAAAVKLGSNPSVADINNVVNKLAATPVGDVKDVKLDLGSLTPDQKTAIANKLVEFSASDAGVTMAKATINAATSAIQSTEKMFSELHVKLGEIDGKYTSPATGAFAPKLEEIRTSWRATVKDSKDLAVEISAYAKKFKDLILPLACDDTEKLEFKTAKITGFITVADGYRTRSGKMQVDFNAILTKFESLRSGFTNWATEKTATLQAELKVIQGDLDTLNGELSQRQRELIGVGAGAALTLPVTGVAACLAGPFAPAVIIFGCIAAVALTTTAIVLASKISRLKDQIATKEAEKKKKKAEIDELEAARQALIKLGDEDLKLLRADISALTTFWSFTEADAKKVLLNLKDMNDNMDWPKHFNMSKANVITIYQSMATYLEEYAKGITIV